MKKIEFDTGRPYGRVNAAGEKEKFGQLIEVKIDKKRVGFYDRTRLILGWWSRDTEWEIDTMEDQPDYRVESTVMSRYDNNQFHQLGLADWEQFSDSLELWTPETGY